MMSKSYRLTSEEINDAVGLTQKLVAIPTESPEGEHYEEFIDCLEEEIKRRVSRLEIERIIVPQEAYKSFPKRLAEMKGPRIILLVRIKAPGKPKAHINDHYDVVKAGNLEKWTISMPYEPKVINNRIYGRGSCDPKGSIVALFEALKIIEREGYELNYDLTISITPDEEVGGYTGLSYLVEETQRGNKLICGEFFFSLDGAQNYISNGKAGLINFSIEIQGVAAHVARSFTGVNAIHLAALVLKELMELKEMAEKKVSRWPVNPELALGFVHPNLNINIIKGGLSNETIPDSCLLVGNRTVLPEESLAEAQNELVNAILAVKQRYQIPLKFTVEPVLPSFITPDDFPALQRLREIAGRGGKKMYPVACSEGYNDISIVSELGMPIFGRGVQWEDCQVHAYNESVAIEYIKTATEDLVSFLAINDRND